MIYLVGLIRRHQEQIRNNKLQLQKRLEEEEKRKQEELYKEELDIMINEHGYFILEILFNKSAIHDKLDIIYVDDYIIRPEE